MPTSLNIYLGQTVPTVDDFGAHDDPVLQAATETVDLGPAGGLNSSPEVHCQQPISWQVVLPQEPVAASSAHSSVLPQEPEGALSIRSPAQSPSRTNNPRGTRI